MPRRFNEKLHPRKHNGQWAKKGTGVLLPPKSGKSRSYASRNRSRVGAGTRDFAKAVNKPQGSVTKSGRKSNTARNLLLAGAVVGAVGLAAYAAHKNGLSTNTTKGLSPSSFKLLTGPKGSKLITGIRPRLQGPGGRFVVTRSNFPRGS